jgi:hypothetical protein
MFRARIYHSNSEGYALVFKGTGGALWEEDWRTNLGQGAFGSLVPSEYDEAIEIGKRVSMAVGSHALIMVGHSLGGGLADAAAFATNRPAVTFNAAGLHWLNQLRTNSGNYSNYMTNYSVEGEVLTTGSELLPVAPVTPGVNYVLKPSPVDAFAGTLTRHHKQSVLDALGVGAF